MPHDPGPPARALYGTGGRKSGAGRRWRGGVRGCARRPWLGRGEGAGGMTEALCHCAHSPTLLSLSLLYLSLPRLSLTLPHSLPILCLSSRRKGAGAGWGGGSAARARPPCCDGKPKTGGPAEERAVTAAADGRPRLRGDSGHGR